MKSAYMDEFNPLRGETVHADAGLMHAGELLAQAYYSLYGLRLTVVCICEISDSFACIYACIYICMYLCMYVCVCVCMCVCACVCMDVYMYVCVCVENDDGEG